MIYTTNDGRQCAVVFTGTEPDRIDDMIHVGFLDGTMKDWDTTEFAWVPATELTPSERMNSDSATVLDLDEFRTRKEQR